MNTSTIVREDFERVDEAQGKASSIARTSPAIITSEQPSLLWYDVASVRRRRNQVACCQLVKRLSYLVSMTMWTHT